MFMRKLRKDKRGLSLIELVCAIAILSIITTTVGGAMVMATNSYRQSTSDTALQQEAQFTANSIESLIIDATQTVEVIGNVLKISNTDFIYEITYDAAAKTLTYSQFETGTLNPVVVNAMLAENVESFVVDASDFANSRNVILEIGMKNESTGKKFVTSYNITSRNDPNAGANIEITAAVQCLDEIIMEPLQNYMLRVSVVGPAGVAYTAHFLDDGGAPVNATANVVSGGVDITMGANEDGDSDGKVTLRISTNVFDSSGNPFYKDVSVRIRRVNDVNLSTLSIANGGEPYKAGTSYTVTATPVGTNFECASGQQYDQDYVNPDTIKWSFATPDGAAVADWVSVDSGITNNTLIFTLQQDIKKGDCLTITATAYHPEGAEFDGNWSNKASAQTGSVAKYDTKAKPVKLQKTGGITFADDNIRRGTENYAYIDFDYKDLVKEEYEKNHPGEYDESQHGYNGGYTGYTYFRFISEDGEDTSAGYPKWIKMADQGDDEKRLKFNASDFNGMKYMKLYNLEIVFAFKYNTNGNGQGQYPEKFDPNVGDSVGSEYIYVFPINPMSVKFDAVKDTTGTVIEMSETYLTGDGDGIGTFDNPLPLHRGQGAKIHFHVVTGATSKQGAIDDVITGSSLYEWGENGWTYKGTPEFSKSEFVYEDSTAEKVGENSGTVTLNIQNNVTADRKYKIVMGPVKQVVSSGETYAEEPVANKGGRGIIYFELQ